MAELCSPLPTGGYECEFVEAVSDSLFCPVCLLPFRDPHLLDCCGAKYCAVCISRVKTAGQPCPLCKEQFTTMLDKSYQRKVLSLMVRCSRKKDGCDWEGELRHLEHHQMEECEWALVKCCYECGVCVPRPQLVEHELHLCPKRPVDVKLESAMTKMEERHKREMDTVKEEFRSKMVAVKDNLQREIERKNQEIATLKEEFSREMEKKEKNNVDMKEKFDQEIIGQREEYTSRMEEFRSKIISVKGDFQREIEKEEQKITAIKEELKEEIKKKDQEMAALKEEFKRQVDRGELETEKKLAEQRKEIKEYTNKMKVMEESLVKLTQEMRVHLSFPPCELVMTEYSKHKRDDDRWYSPPFYTGPGGYKMCLRVDANGYGDGAGTHVSVYVYLMKGEHDDKLTWPFLGDITIQLVNQNSDQVHVENILDFTEEDAADGETSGRVTSEERAQIALGFHTFISHAKLESTAFTQQYLKNDCMKFRVTKIVVHSV